VHSDVYSDVKENEITLFTGNTWNWGPCSLKEAIPTTKYHMFSLIWRSQDENQGHEIKRGTTGEIGRDKEKEGEPQERVKEGRV
jgi:hypothetical protein